TCHSLSAPLPRQLAATPRAPPRAAAFATFAPLILRPRARIQYWPPFLEGMPVSTVGYPRVTHPFATRTAELLLTRRSSYDLHVLSTPPAFALSQDQTRQKKR